MLLQLPQGLVCEPVNLNGDNGFFSLVLVLTLSNPEPDHKNHSPRFRFRFRDFPELDRQSSSGFREIYP